MKCLLALVLVSFVGCSSAAQKKAEMASKTAAYSLALEQCLSEQTEDAYDICAKEVDKKFGRTP